MADTINIEILPDGTIKSTTDPISPANHANAEGFMKALTTLTGGDVTRQKRTGHRHEHAHTHTHHD